MTKLAIAVALALVSGSNALSKQQAQTPSLEESVVDFYVDEFQRVVNVTPELDRKSVV